MTAPGMGTWPGDPVVVVGNGPVGQTAALLLARWGVPSVVLDRRAARDLVGSRAICQQGDVLDVWESVGARVAAEGVTWTTARTFHRSDELFAVRLGDQRGTLPPFVNVSQAHTERLLDERIAAQPLIDVRWSHPVDTITQDAAGVIVAGPEFRLRAEYVLVCAGARAETLRGQLGVRFDGHSFADRFLICDIRAELPGWATERRFYFDPEWNPGRQVLIHPCPDSTYRIDWQVPSDYDLAEEVATGALDGRIRAIVGDTPYELVWSSVYRFHTRCADRLRVGRVLLAGDAAHVYAPFGARGLNSGVADAENAAWKLAFAGRGWGGPEVLLESYHAERHAAAEENVRVTAATMDFLVPRTAEAAEHRAAVLARARTDPAARAGVDSGRLSAPHRYLASPLTTVAPTAEPALAPTVALTAESPAAERAAGERSAAERAAGERPAAQHPTVDRPGPGAIVPDLPVRGGRGSLRRWCRDGLLVLAAPGAATDVAVPAGPVPVRVLAMTGLSAELAGVLGARPGQWWVVRPDAHVAAVVADRSALVAAVHRALGSSGAPGTAGTPGSPGSGTPGSPGSGTTGSPGTTASPGTPVSKEDEDGLLPTAR
ncbi:MAG TPA: FAD-dependent monooxygenase [Pseudonocardia sp.]